MRDNERVGAVSDLGYELWQRVSPPSGAPEYTWMVWKVGPMRDGEHWFQYRAEAEAFIAAQESAAAAHGLAATGNDT